MTEYDKVFAATEAVNTIVITLNRLDKAGKFSDDDRKEITGILLEARAYLGQWRASAKAKTERPDLGEAILDCLMALEIWTIEPSKQE